MKEHMIDEIEKLIKSYDRRSQRYKSKEKFLEEKSDRLGNHGYWNLGYCEAKVDLYEDVIDDLRDLLIRETCLS